MRRTDIINVLVAKGYKAEAKDSVKNGVIFEGILIQDENKIAPIIYTEQLIAHAEKEGMSIGEVVEEVIRVYEMGKQNIEFDVNHLYEKEWVLQHLNVAVQKVSEQDLVKKEVEKLEGIEAYVYIKKRNGNDGNFEVKLTKDHLEVLNISESEAWKKAYENMCEETEIISMQQIMSELLGMPEDSELENEDSMMYVVSNKERIKGASAILNRKALEEFASQKGVSKLFVLPSSVHETILIADCGGLSLEELSNMVTEVNASEVRPEEQLPNRAYILEF